MSNENFSFKDYSLAPADLVPPDDPDEPDAVDERQARQAQYRHRIHLEDVLLCALSHFQQRAEVLAFTQDAMECPYHPDLPNVHVSEALKIARALALDIQAAIDDQVFLLDLARED